MNSQAANPTDRKELRGAVQNERLSSVAGRSGNKEVTLDLVITRFLSFRERQASIRQFTELLLIRRFLMDGCKIPFLREPKL